VYIEYWQLPAVFISVDVNRQRRNAAVEWIVLANCIFSYCWLQSRHEATLTASHHVDKAADGLAHVTIQYDEMHGTRCSYCVFVAVQAVALLVSCGNGGKWWRGGRWGGWRNLGCCSDNKIGREGQGTLSFQYSGITALQPIPVATRSKAWVYVL
jgi:hypothetical protein